MVSTTNNGALKGSSITRIEDLSTPEYGSSQKAVDEITQKLGKGKVSFVRKDLDDHSDAYFSSDHASDDQRPKAVFYPETTEEVSFILKTTHNYHVPVVPVTGRTSLEGNFIPTRQGICVDIARMNKILAVHEKDLDVTVEAGVGWQDLDKYLKDYNLLFGPDPGPGARIGGMVATSCSGPSAARWGTMKENVIGLTAVLADGTIIKTKKRPRKSSAGYNLNGLFIGSEGTLAVITEATLKLNVRPKVTNVALVSFSKISDAGKAVAGFVQEGLQLDAMELLDDTMMHYVNLSGKTSLKYEELPTLMLKFGGPSKEIIDYQVKAAQRICQNNNNQKYLFAQSQQEEQEIWGVRKVALLATIEYGRKHIDKDIQVWATDVAVPISRLYQSLQETKDELQRLGIAGSIVGHVGDGNYHAMILFKKEEHAKVAVVVEHMMERALLAEGTITGEHGVGWGKKHYLQEEVSDETLALMRRIKIALDPYGLLNPDKVFDMDPAYF